ncbi:hypothetical protein WICMUC_002024 [Wickerhamomyces mucosus]|uniref:Uncharacterized protein n=1 Tax=Wickerhamomyces mucosus TaxID=1378264 RepID=A0A9P8PQ74_9ASCO|nr:hypothetical protein WICMUC_002024 [Wickerhamomyces mucosus]
MPTPFKFGKKRNKDSITPSGSSSIRDVSFSSPSSNKNRNDNNGFNNSPQSSDYSNNSHLNTNNNKSNPPGNSSGIEFDHNNNLRSPQRTQQQKDQQYRGVNQTPLKPQPQQHPQTYNEPTQVSPWIKSKLLISPFPRYRHTASTISNEKGEILVMGGLHTTSVYGDTWIIKQEPESQKFQTIQVDIYDNSPAPRVGHASTLCGNAYVIFGGDTVTNQEGGIDNDLYLFNMNSHTWTIPNPIGRKPSGRYGHKIGIIAITNYDSKVYLYGGQLDDVIFDDLVMFNLSSFRRPDVHWEWITPKGDVRPPKLTNHTMDVYDNRLFIFGGSNKDQLFNDVWRFDPVTDLWELIKTFGDIPPPLEEHASVVHKDILIIHGGKVANGTASNDTYFLNLLTKTWFKLPSKFNNQPGKYGHTISILKNEKLLLLGGQLPDFAKIGEDLEPTMQDQGVGTILNILDLSVLNQIIPNLQNNIITPNFDQERFANNQNQRSIFTPPTQSANVKSPVNFNSDQASPIPKVDAPILTFSEVGANNRQGHQRAYSAEDVFQRGQEQRQILSSHRKDLNSEFGDSEIDEYSHNTSPTKQQSTRKQVIGFSSPPEEELPLDLPSPIKSNSTHFPANDQLEVPLQVPIQLKNSVINNDSLDDGFETGKSSPVSELKEPVYVNPVIGKSSDILDSYVDPITESLEQFDVAIDASHSSTATGTNNLAVLDAGVSETHQHVLNAQPFEPENDKTPSVVSQNPDHASRLDSRELNLNSDEKQQFKTIIESLSNELKQLKISTKDQIKLASDKIKQLESENEDLKNRNKGFNNEVDALNESDVKRKYVQLNTDFIILTENHKQLQSKYDETHPVFSTNLIELSKLNQIIEQQSDKIESQQNQLKGQNDWKLKYEQLSLKLQNLEAENNELVESKNLKFYESHNDVRKLSAGIDTFLSKYLTKNKDTNEYEYESNSIDQEINTKDTSVVKELRTQIDQLLQENEQHESQTKSLSSEISQLSAELEDQKSKNKDLFLDATQLKDAQQEVESLRSRLTEIDSRYKESLHSVSNTSKALRLSETELNRSKELNKSLQNEIEEIKLSSANSKKSSRNATPVINDYKANGASKQVSENSSEDDFDNSHYNLKISDLEAELYIIKQERDELKENVLTLKKDLFKARQGN